MFNYSNRRTDVKVGSAFALTLDSVKTLLEKVQKWVDSTSDFEQLFNQLSCYVWLVFCVLTGIRPNNALGAVRDIDLEVGWIMVKDKPNKKVQNHRLIPLCDTLIKHLVIYQKILAILRTQSLITLLSQQDYIESRLTMPILPCSIYSPKNLISYTPSNGAI